MSVASESCGRFCTHSGFRRRPLSELCCRYGATTTSRHSGHAAYGHQRAFAANHVSSNSLRSCAAQSSSSPHTAAYAMLADETPSSRCQPALQAGRVRRPRQQVSTLLIPAVQPRTATLRKGNREDDRFDSTSGRPADSGPFRARWRNRLMQQARVLRQT